MATPPHYIDGTAFECREIEPADQRSSRTSTATHRTGSAVSARGSSRDVGSMGSMSSFRSGLSSKTGKDDDAGRQVIIDWTRIPKALMQITGGYGDGPLIAIFACYGLKAEVTMYSLTQKQKLRTVTIGHWANNLTIMRQQLRRSRCFWWPARSHRRYIRTHPRHFRSHLKNYGHDKHKFANAPDRLIQWRTAILVHHRQTSKPRKISRLPLTQRQ